MLLALLASVAGGAEAAMTHWANNEGGRMRIVALPPDETGKVRAALQIEPAAGWMTYWREPGDSGIPPQLSIAPESNLALSSIDYPVPVSMRIGDARDIVYDRAVTLPLTFSVIDKSLPAELKADVFIGLCKNICIPFQSSFSLLVDKAGQSLAEETQVLEAAKATLPEAPSDEFAVRGFALAEDRKKLRLDLELPYGTRGPLEVIVTGPSGYVYSHKQAKGAMPGELALDISVSRFPAKYDPKGKQWGLLVIAGNRAMETKLAFD
ncbi:cytochrome C biogenesis protein [Rhizobiaceae bacterium n13]|uniref:Cytochrome C biogenesis protein n=1 Tax=Ferirhizobium litorale TaxID=2927786 RepID=A0AAE3U005_9HYPH|nr:protein-disulfide reductase DsbD domain-containing protein [Fererhizobium litorale]MDI7861417.1 cytochrome C biogenesis protein [Fererhizobium litorale]MDI7921564.1 cytochrome C biogenesis protein [Fererhizobium litorale]